MNDSKALELAVLFHVIYERKSAEFDYVTRTETRIFDPESKNGKLMIATCEEILQDYVLKDQVAVADAKEVSTTIEYQCKKLGYVAYAVIGAAELKQMERDNIDLKYERDNLIRVHETDRRTIEHFHDVEAAYQLAVHETVVATGERNDLRLQLAQAQEAVEEARMLLKKIEWTLAESGSECPYCHNSIYEHEHKPDCKLSAWLSANEVKK